MKFSHLNKTLSDLKKNNTFRESRTISVSGHSAIANPKNIASDPKNIASKIASDSLINFSSNDYLGLAGDTELQARFFQQIDVTQNNWMSASSSRPLTGTSASHTKLESLLANSYGKTGALLYNSGYHANTGILPALTTEKDLIIADKLVHASLIDGLKLSDAKFKRFAHNNIDHLKQLLSKYRSQFKDVWIVTESVFSMDGDSAPLAELVALKNEYQCFLYLDEAHAVGCLGDNGLGLAEQLNLIDEVDLIIGTFGKALAGCGGYAVGDQVLIDSMINFSRAWLFSTALPPINIDWNLFIWQQLSNFDQQRKKLSNLSTLFKAGLVKSGINHLGDSHIVPVIVAGNEHVVAFAKNLEKNGVLAMPIRSPTVVTGSERIRFSLTANMPESALSYCLECINDL